MSDTNAYGPILYNAAWGVIGISFLIIASIIVAIIFYTTRKKPIKRASNLITYKAKTINLNSLKEKYLPLIDRSVLAYEKKNINASTCHQQLSMIVRLFFYESLGFHAEVMTLNDLKKTKYEKLSQLIGEYYPDEFNTLERGSVKDAAEKARKLLEEQ